jgi:hypothetical protein
MLDSIVQEVVEHLNALPSELQEQVLALARALDASQRQGVPGSSLVRFAGLIPPDDLEAMRDAIERGCEQVDLAQL